MPGKPHILVVEDDSLVSEVVAAALNDDYDTSLVETAAAAIKQLHDSHVDLLLLDCTLPDGIDNDLIPDADRIGVPILFMSGDPSRIERLVDQPRPFVLKPFTLTALLDAVEKAIDTRQAG